MASTNLKFTPSSTGNKDKWTWSAWVKLSKVGADQNLFTGYDASTFYTEIQIGDTGRLNFINKISGSEQGKIETTRVFRDTSSWYHFVIVWDSGNATAGNRMRVYVNGVEETSFATDTNPSVNQDSALPHATRPLYIGSWGQSSKYFDGLMSHIHFADGQAYAPTVFGETDTTTGEWKAKTSPSVTYGTNGFFILKDGNSVTDQSGRGNNFTVDTGTLTDLKDNPDNVFATMNPLDNFYANAVFSNGNNSITTNNNARTFTNSTFGMTSGKYYCEMKSTGVEAGAMVGIIATSPTSATNRADNNPYAWQYINGGTMKNNGNTQSGTWASWVSGDILGIALDLDNNKIYFSKNGVWQNTGSANPSTGTDGFAITAVSALPVDQAGCYFFNCQDNSTSTELSYFNWNFGNGYFGTTAITTNSGNGYSGAEGSSKFNYTVPTGYSALSTKGLNE